MSTVILFHLAMHHCLLDITQQKEVDKALVATRVRSIGCRVVDVAMGPSHTAVLTETGQVSGFLSFYCLCV